MQSASSPMMGLDATVVQITALLRFSLKKVSMRLSRDAKQAGFLSYNTLISLLNFGLEHVVLPVIV